MTILLGDNMLVKDDSSVFTPEITVLKQKIKNKNLETTYLQQKIAQKNLKRYAREAGLSRSSFIFTGKLPLHEHLARARLVDIALDTQIYSGGATTANMLWAGVPVITVYGKHFLSRMSSSILINIGLEELVTNNLKEYEDLAVKLATNKELFTKLKHKLELNRNSYPLFDSRLFTKNLEKVYEKVWINYLQDKKTDIII